MQVDCFPGSLWKGFQRKQDAEEWFLSKKTSLLAVPIADDAAAGEGSPPPSSTTCLRMNSGMGYASKSI